ncbi:MAG TPA: hypothetical protein PKI55_12790 [Chitinophagaceae bacterium]|nr:hypothetical protein [Chitinophagaceae bacterium]
MSKKLTTFQILRNKFPANEYVLIQEVSDASGFSRSRSLDYMLINLWQSRGLAVTGIEQKSHRSDWLNELKNPKKQENHYKHCDYFYLLTTNEKVASLDEIPITWGWYHINSSGILKTLKPAPKLTPEPIGRSMMCAMLKRAASKENYVLLDEIEERIEQRAEMIYQSKKREFEQKKDLLKILQEQVAAFEKESGISILNGWGWVKHSEKVGRAVKFLIDYGFDNYEERVKKIEDHAKRLWENISSAIKELKNEP